MSKIFCLLIDDDNVCIFQDKDMIKSWNIKFYKGASFYSLIDWAVDEFKHRYCDYIIGNEFDNVIASLENGKRK